MSNKILYGLEKVHIAFLDSEGETQPAWATPTAISGAVGFSADPQGGETTFYADNGPYFTMTSNNGYTGELEMALIPDTILAEMLGWEIDTNGMLVEIADATPKPFALMGQIQGDSKNRRFVYYHCTASRSAQEHTTKGENVEPATDTLTLTMVPLEIGGKKVTKGTLELSDANAAVYDAFFTAVTVPGTAPAA